ncbi:hypothetical protein Cassandra_0401 [Pseudomonas phage Cassandra]|nr:hypothetical protein Cassandra_0401 [Pseudomonas phage Cassandra]
MQIRIFAINSHRESTFRCFLGVVRIMLPAGLLCASSSCLSSPGQRRHRPCPRRRTGLRGRRPGLLP